MYSGNVVSYKTILDKTIRDFGFNTDINDEEALEWLAEFMAHTNSPITLENKIAYLEVCDGRADLPNDLHRIVQTACLYGITTIDEAEHGLGTLLPMRWSTDNFHKRYHKDDRDYTSESRDTYTVGQGYIFPSFDKGIIAMSYEAIPTDDCGYPTIPAEQQWVEAAAHYIAHRIARKLWLRNEITSDKFQIIERDKEWYFAQAVNHSKQWNGVDEAESFQSSWLRTIPSIQDHSNFFANMQIPEQRNFRPKSHSTTGASSSFSVKESNLPNPATATAVPGFVCPPGYKSYITQFTSSGNGIADTITHNLNSQNITVTITDTVTHQEYFMQVTITGNNTIEITHNGPSFGLNGLTCTIIAPNGI